MKVMPAFRSHAVGQVVEADGTGLVAVRECDLGHRTPRAWLHNRVNCHDVDVIGWSRWGACQAPTLTVGVLRQYTANGGIRHWPRCLQFSDYPVKILSGPAVLEELAPLFRYTGTRIVPQRLRLLRDCRRRRRNARRGWCWSLWGLRRHRPVGLLHHPLHGALVVHRTGIMSRDGCCRAGQSCNPKKQCGSLDGSRRCSAPLCRTRGDLFPLVPAPPCQCPDCRDRDCSSDRPGDVTYILQAALRTVMFCCFRSPCRSAIIRFASNATRIQRVHGCSGEEDQTNHDSSNTNHVLNRGTIHCRIMWERARWFPSQRPHQEPRTSEIESSLNGPGRRPQPARWMPCTVSCHAGLWPSSACCGRHNHVGAQCYEVRETGPTKRQRPLS